MSYLGTSGRRREDGPLLQGRGCYVDDVIPAGTLYLALARSPYAHARLTGLSVAAAAAVPGVLSVLTAEDLPPLNPMPLNQRMQKMLVPAHAILAPVGDVIHAMGVPIAAIAATSRAIAEDAAALVDARYEPLPGVADGESALKPEAHLAHQHFGTNLSWTAQRSDGDLDEAFSGADHVTRLRVHNQRLAAVPIEPRAIVVVPEKAGQELTVWLSTQSPARLRADLSGVLGLPEQSVRIIAPDVGGAFGAKNSVYREDVLTAVMARRLLRPVKWTATRSDDFLTMQHGRDISVEAELALDASGTMRGLRVRGIANLGGYFQTGTGGAALRLLAISSGAYRVPAVGITVLGVLTNTPPIGAYRGAGRPETALVIERLVDEAARELGQDPIALRRKNFIPSSAFPFRTASGTVYDSGDYEKALDRAMVLADYPSLVHARDATRARGGAAGIGVATFIEPSGGGGFESGTVRVERSGVFSALTGTSAQGQGHETVFAQILADRLGVSPDRVAVLHGDTRGAAQGVGTHGSRSIAMGGSALFQAAERVIAKGRRIAAHLLEVSVDDLVLERGAFQVAGATGRAVTWQELATAAYRTLNLPEGEEPGLEATAFFRQDREAFGFGTHLAAVQIDRETGRVQLDRVVCVDDCGTVVNPLLASGQVQGGLAQGLGQALLESIVFDEDGQLLSGSLGDYALPRATDLPDGEKVTIDHTVTPSPLNPLGAKGIGEAGTIGIPAAIANAVADALAPLGVRNPQMPFTPHRIWKLLQQAGD